MPSYASSVPLIDYAKCFDDFRYNFSHVLFSLTLGLGKVVSKYPAIK